PLTLGDVVTGESPYTDLMASVTTPLRFLFNNPYAAIRLDSVTVTIAASPRRAEWTLHSARVLDAAVRPGGSLRIECDVDRWHGESSRLTMRIPVPEQVPDGRLILWVGGGSELTRYEATRLPGRYRPASLEDAWRRLA